ncbi:hypothetical protein [Aureimonas psammosilenae]|uniref:hypothetical protein n=1 Tax=Aureimonas psammosilenae TaxID=2495496 RepID=UPI001260ECC8|nr:hypothetical protein [Aureimonas psammosilenae]
MSGEAVAGSAPFSLSVIPEAGIVIGKDAEVMTIPMKPKQVHHRIMSALPGRFSNVPGRR